MGSVPADRGVVPSLAALGQQIAVHRALLVLAEAVGERVIETIEAELTRTTCVGAVQERAVWAVIHS